MIVLIPARKEVSEDGGRLPRPLRVLGGDQPSKAAFPWSTVCPMRCTSCLIFCEGFPPSPVVIHSPLYLEAAAPAKEAQAEPLSIFARVGRATKSLGSLLGFTRPIA